MTRTCIVGIALLMAAVARAADEPKPNTLTPKEITEGWILLFDGDSTFGWKIDGEATIKGGFLILGGKKETRAEVTTWLNHYQLRCESYWDGDSGPKIKHQGFVLSLGDLTKGKLYPRDFTSYSASLSDPVMSVVVPAGSVLKVHNVKLRPLGTNPLFNGKDLTGWKKFEGDAKRAKSTFAVNKDGELTIKDGPGDLATEGQWADFVLQIECKSNGKHLNSGVFFRCRPGEYQNGYEAQIHNGWTDEAKKEYTIEEYDPKTNELKDKKKIKSASLDYGTGAIYRRIPARKAVAKDNEWFTMTVIARGRHLSTWVNGVQVVDWIDNRPLKDNARNGCKLEKGPISLQGHDPTTDLNFRNIRLAELPAKK